jgi:RNA polymerase sigma-70 factor, ECF subfamily
MELERTRTRTRNELRRFKAAPLAMVPPRYSHDVALFITRRTDDDLVQAAQSGDHEAFAELCRRHAQVARQKILAIVRHREDAEDALQETLLRAYANLGRFRQSAKFSTWTTAIGVNAAFTGLRKKKSRRELDIEPSNPEEPARDIADQAPDPQRRVEKKQILLFLRTELQTLPPRMREVVINYCDQGSSQQEAADVLGISLAAFKSRLLRGRRRLRSSFEQKGLLSSYSEWQ